MTNMFHLNLIATRNQNSDHKKSLHYQTTNHYNNQYASIHNKQVQCRVQYNIPHMCMNYIHVTS